MKISIDIGTSYSSVCMQNLKGEVKPVEISTGISIYGSKYSLPSAVFVEDNGEVLVGQAAMNSRKKKPQNFRSEFKRDLGQKIPIMLGGRSFLPEELYTELLRHMKECAEKSGNDIVEKAYITHPASFGRAKCDKIRQAAKNAGIFDAELLDEPTAAAMGYKAKGSLKDGDILLVYDFGGGTFDVSLLQYEDSRYTPLTPAMGIEHCGGIDIDRIIYADMISKIDSEILQQLSANRTNRMRFEGQLAELAVKVKHHLSNADHANEAIAIGFDILDYELNRNELDGMIAEIVSQTVDCCKNILINSGIGIQAVNGILLVGGSSRIPLVQEMVRKFAGSTPIYMDADPDLAIVMGALEQEGIQIQTCKSDLYNEKQADVKSVESKHIKENKSDLETQPCHNIDNSIFSPAVISSDRINNPENKLTSVLLNSEKLDQIKQMCHDFAKDSSEYQGNEKLYKTLGIQGQEVYLAHDDSLFHRGKNGFAITQSGIYCCDFGSSKSHVTFSELAKTNTIYIKGTEIYTTSNQIAYFTGLDSERKRLKELFEEIWKSLNSEKLNQIKQMCHDFAKDSSEYQGNEKLYKTLGIQGQEVYLAYDSSWFHRGKNGFAITQNGIYCCGFISSTTHMTFSELARVDNIYIKGTDIFANSNNQIAYFCGANSEMERLKKLFEKISKVF